MKFDNILDEANGLCVCTRANRHVCTRVCAFVLLNTEPCAQVCVCVCDELFPAPGTKAHLLNTLLNLT